MQGVPDKSTVLRKERAILDICKTLRAPIKTKFYTYNRDSLIIGYEVLQVKDDFSLVIITTKSYMDSLVSVMESVKWEEGKQAHLEEFSLGMNPV